MSRGLVHSKEMPDLEVEREIREIKREIIESRGLVIKTNNLTSTLGSDLKSIAKRQAGYERRLIYNSAVAYIITVGVVFVGAYLSSDYRARRFEAQIAALEQEKQELQNKLKAKQQSKVNRAHALQKAERLVDLITKGERQKVITAVANIERDELSPLETRFLDETAQRFRTELSLAAFQEGLEHARQKRYDEAVTSFQHSVKMVKAGPHVARVHLHLAQALRFQGKVPEAVAVLETLLDSDLLDRELVAESRWNLAICFIETHKRDEARRELIYVLNKFPRSQWARMARPKIMEVNKMR